MNRTILLTGGETAKSIYREMRDIDKEGSFLERSNFFLTDERCVPSTNNFSNHCMILENLFCNQIPESSVLHKMFLSEQGIENSVINYENLIPPLIDLLILSVGSDGHIASIFNNASISDGPLKLVGLVSSSDLAIKRISILPSVIVRANVTVILAIGKQKERFAMFAREGPEKLKNMPIGLVSNAIWIVGDDFRMAAKKMLEVWKDAVR